MTPLLLTAPRNWPGARTKPPTTPRLTLRSNGLSRPSARLLKVPFAQRDIFLDHFQTSEFIRKQLKKLVRIAIRHGEAIGIGHPYPVTIEVLSQELPKLKNQVELVPASAVVHVIG